MLPSALLDWFWLAGAGLMLLYAALVFAGAGPLVRAGRVTENERRRFAGGLGLITAGFCLVIQIVVWLTGESRPGCLAALPPTTTASLVTNILTLAAWAALLLWVWWGRGADTLARFAPAILRTGTSARTYTPAQVRRFVTGFILLATLGSVAASLVGEAPSDCRDWPPRSQRSAS